MTDTPTEVPHNPWREFIENCMDGSNYFRASEYMELLSELDDGYKAQARVAELEAQLADLQSQLAAQRERDGRELAEANRQLALYRKAINKMDDMTEYARPGLSREELRAIFAELTVALVPVPGGEGK